MASPVEPTDRELRLYRRLCLLVGAVYLVWWGAVEVLLPQAYNPLLGRLGVVAAIWAIVVASHASVWVRRQIRMLWICSLWLLTSHYFYLFYENAGDINWVVGSFITITAVSLGFMSRGPLIAYSAFATVLSVILVIALPTLRQSVFLPGLMTVLLQANIGLNSRLGALRDLAASNAHFQLLFDSTFEGVMIHERGRIVQVNDALVGILGYTREELIGSEVLALVHPDDRAVAREGMTSAGPSRADLRWLRKDGAEVDVEARGKPLPYRKRPQRLVTLTDVTERNRRTAELRRTNAALARSNLDLQRFAYIASHDLQTPLRSIASFVDLVRSTYGDELHPQARDWLSRTSQSVDHLQTLIRDLLEYSRVDAKPRAFATVATSAVLAEVTALLDAEVRGAGATVTSSDLPDVTGERSELVQLLLNLVGNAIKYRGQAAPVVHISAQTRDEDWLFEVRDNGIGIAQKHHQQVFEIFKRLHDQKEYPGTGIGLAICRRIVDRHGGKIWVESRPAEGSVFFFTIARGTEGQR